MVDRTAALERNLRLFGWHEVLVAIAPWGVVFALFNRARFDVEGAIALAGIYYLAVVVFEVPSGWASDRFGRVPTLRIIGVAWMAAMALWIGFDESFMALAAGNVLVALGYASLSGTDVSFHFDTLEALGRSHEFADCQARIVARARASSAITAVGGGALGLIELRLPFVASLFIAAAQFAVAMRFVEPPHKGEAEAPIAQVKRALGYLANVPLRWIFGYGVAMVVLEHVAINQLGPWLTGVLGESADDLGSTPLVTGVVLAVMGLIGAAAARGSTPTAQRFGARATLVGLGALSALIVTMMAAFAHLWVLVFVVLRSVQSAAAPILLTAAAAPLVEQRQRATFFSLNSLGGRAAWGLILLAVSRTVGDDVTAALTRYAAIAWFLVVGLVVSGIAVGRRHGPVAFR